MYRAASHYIWCFGQCHRLHYIEWDINGNLVTLAPLEEELAGVAFYNGSIAVIPANESPTALPEELQQLCAKVQPDSPISVYKINGEKIYP